MRLALMTWALALPALALEPGKDARDHLTRVEQNLNDWDVEGAKAELALLEGKVPNEVETLKYFKGRVAFEEGRYEEAISLLDAARIGDKAGSYLRLAKDTLKLVKDHERAQSEHFLFLTPKGKDQLLAPYALEALETIRAALLKDLGHAPPGKVRVEVVNDARELAKVSTLTYEQIKTTGTIAICKFSKLMVTSPKATLRGYDWLDTLAHEYVHLVVSQLSRNTVPIWIHEGLAKYYESRWRGEAGQAMTPSQLALLGARLKKNDLVPFEKMHPSMALLPSAEDAATAFAEVFFVVDFLNKRWGPTAVTRVIASLKSGASDEKAIENATALSFPAFEKAWLEHVRSQRFPKELISMASEKVVLKEEAGRQETRKKKGKDQEVSFGDFVEVEEAEARKLAHLGELLRERDRLLGASEEYAKAFRLVGDKYESVSNKYALTLLALKRPDEAEKVLVGSLRVHPNSPTTQVHLGRLYLERKDLARAKKAYLGALASDPFDEEIHVGLLAIYKEEGNRELASRAARAVELLGAVEETR